MQTATSTLLAAIQSSVRRPVARVKADWARNDTYVFESGVFRDTFSDTFEAAGDMGDLSGWVGSVSVDRSIATDLPENAKVITGNGAASATVTLAGHLAGGTGLVQALSGAGSSSGWLARVNTPITIDLGFVGSAGPEYLRAFTGKIRSVTVNPADASVTLSLLDFREKVRTPVTFNVVSWQTGNYYMSAIATANAVTLTADTSMNVSVSTAAVESSDPWTTLQQLAEAEQGIILFDESGNLLFYNRNRMAGGSAVATLTSLTNIKAILSEEAVDAVANYVTVGANPLALDSPGATIWALNEVIGIFPYSSAALSVEFDAPLYTATSVTYDAQYNSDGTGGSAVGSVFGVYAATTATSGTVTFTNTGPTLLYLVDSAGTPTAGMTGRLLRPTSDSGYLAVRQDTGSQSVYGVQTLDVSANPWLQSGAVADALADYLLLALREPHVTLSTVEIVGDPRLQLTDRVRVVESDGLALDGEFWLVGITTTFDASGGLSQSVTLREA